ncbi:MAG: AAA family ATPase, partial [Bacteroidetes bacterium]
MENQNYPIGIQDFAELSEGKYLYVDKTKYIFKMLHGKYYFLSRPRRFGKSLLVNTLYYLFDGRKDLFKGLFIEDKIE